MSDNVHYLQGIAKINENKHLEAIELLTRAIEDEPGNPFFYNHRAVAYLNLGMHDLSMFDMNMSIQLDEQYAYFFSCRGFLKARMKDLEGAIADYEISLELDPENEITYNNLGLVLEQMGSMARAQSMYKKGNDLLGYDPEQRELNQEGTHMVDKDASEPEKKNSEQKSAKKTRRKEKQKAVKEVFSNKKAFKEFLGFIGNGFKLKSPDKNTKEDQP